MDRKTIGIIFIVSASMLWAMETIFGKIALSQTPDFIQTAFIRSSVIALVGFFFIIFTNKHAFKVSIDKLSKITYIAFAAAIVADSLFYYALINSPVLNATLIPHIQPVFIAIFGYFMLKHDKLTANDYTGIFLTILASFFVATKTIENILSFQFGSFEDLLLVIGAVFWATTAIVAKKYLSEMNTGAIVFYRFLIASIVFGAFLFLSGKSFFSNYFQILAGITAGFGFIFFYGGLKRTKAAQASAVESFTPLFAGILGFFFLGETVTILQLLGVVALFIGVHFLSKKES